MSDAYFSSCLGNSYQPYSLNDEPEQQPLGMSASNLDFAKIFDDEAQQNSPGQGGNANAAFDNTMSSSQAIMASLVASYNEAAAQVAGLLAQQQSQQGNKLNNPSMNQPPPQQRPPQQQLTQGGGPPLVNVTFIVDPITKQIVCPPQMLSANVGGQVQNTFVGTEFMESINQQQGLSSVPPAIPSTMLTRYFDNSSNTTNPPTVSPTPSFLGLLAAPSSSLDMLSIPQRGGGYSSAVGSDSSFSNTFTAVASEQAGLPPLRALSAYNFFFRDERDRILNGGEQDWSDDKMKKLLNEHWLKDRNAKRRHRKTHGKIDFTTLSKLISTRWKELDEDKKSFYRKIASKDWQRYQSELNCQKAHSEDAIGLSTFTAVVG